MLLGTFMHPPHLNQGWGGEMYATALVVIPFWDSLPATAYTEDYVAGHTRQLCVCLFVLMQVGYLGNLCRRRILHQPTCHRQNKANKTSRSTENRNRHERPNTHLPTAPKCDSKLQSGRIIHQCTVHKAQIFNQRPNLRMTTTLAAFADLPCQSICCRVAPVSLLHCRSTHRTQSAYRPSGRP